MVLLDLNYSTKQCDTSINIDTQTNGTEESLEINICIYRHVNLDKGTKNTQRLKKTYILNQECAEMWISA